MKTNNALVVVDMQKDFMPDGALGVRGADEVVPLINRLVQMPFDLCIATKDWHPPHHISFASTWKKKSGEHVRIDRISQALWPDHCIQDTRGAEFAPGLDTTHFDLIVHKVVEVSTDSYSTFFDNKKARSTGLEDYLREEGVKELYIAGLITDYCVLNSALDAVELGFTPYVILEACRGGEVQPGDVAKAIAKMKEKGIHFCTVDEAEKRIGSHA